MRQATIAEVRALREQKSHLAAWFSRQPLRLATFHRFDAKLPGQQRLRAALEIEYLSKIITYT